MADGTFDTWLLEKLNSLNLDEEVYSDYLKSVVDEAENNEELRESLCDILSGILEDGAQETADEIIKVWDAQKCTDTLAVNGTQTHVNDDNIKALMEQQTQQQQTKFANKKSKNVDHELKNKLIAQYGEISDGEEEDDDDDDDDKPPSDFVNQNAKMVTEKIQQEREKSKKDSEEKKQRDKMNLAKDKSKKDDRKDKEKNRTQKGERRAR